MPTSFLRGWPVVLTLALAGCAGVPSSGGAPVMDVASPPGSSVAAPASPVASPAAPPVASPAATSPSRPVPVTRTPQPADPTGPLQPIDSAQVLAPAVANLEVPPDLWDRIRRGFSMQDLDGELVRQHEEWYASRPDYMRRMTERSRKYLFHIVEELERRNMPLELALLPFIESAFNPQAVSSARAAGIWQFMPATGADFDLRQNVFRDDRRDVLASTRAALDYLQKLHGMFGDWHLALAAYNWGQGNVTRAIQRNQRANLPTGYADLNMPQETRHYVPKLQAVKNIVARPEQFRTELPLIENHPYFQTVTIPRDIDVALAARLADVHLEDFKALNPSLNRPVILAAGTPQILLPWDNATVFQRNLEGYTSGRYASWTAWTATSTMTVAEAARRVGMSEADFRSLNNIPPRMKIRAGSTVLAPRNAQVTRDVAGHVAEHAQLSLLPEAALRRTSVKAGKRDTVESIATRYKVRVSDVARWNEVAPGASFKPGQTVVLELPVRTARAGAKAKGQPKGKATNTAQAQPPKSSSAPAARTAMR
jgi:membrane-bound lytic murein transglycosylase D